jgi:RNA recognition motif. (a.k.a. RRM, RBD, or RNP domain)
MAENSFQRKDDIRRAPKLKVFLGGLPLNWDEEAVQEFMNRFCKVISVTIHRDSDGNSKRFGFAFVQTWNPESVYGRHTVMTRYPDEPEQYLEVKPIKSRPVFISIHEHGNISDADIYHRFLELGHRLASVELLETSRAHIPTTMFRLHFERETSSKDAVSMRMINIKGLEAHLSFGPPSGGFQSQKTQITPFQGQQSKVKSNQNYQNVQSSKPSYAEMGGLQSFGTAVSNQSGPSTTSPKKFFQPNPDMSKESPTDFEKNSLVHHKIRPPSLHRMVSEDEKFEMETTDRNSQPRAVRKLSYSINKGQEFYPTEVGLSSLEQISDSFDQHYIQPSPQLMPAIGQARLFSPITPGLGVPWSPSQAVAGAFTQFPALMPGYTAFQPGLHMQAYTLPSEPVKSKECIIPYYTFPYRE